MEKIKFIVNIMQLIVLLIIFNDKNIVIVIKYNV